MSFLRAYAAAGVPVQAITPQNEPDQAGYYPGLELTESQEARFIGEDLVPALQAASLDPEILGYDFEWNCRHNTTASPCELRYPDELAADPRVGPELGGVAWHCYAGNVHRMGTFHVLMPRLDQVVSECASGRLTPGPPAQLEIAAARNWASAVVLWNIALDRHGGPVQPPNFGCAGCIGLLAHADGWPTTATAPLLLCAGAGHALGFSPLAHRLTTTIRPTQAADLSGLILTASVLSQVAGVAGPAGIYLGLASHGSARALAITTGILAAVMATALIARGVPDTTAQLAAELGVLAFKRGYAQWSEGDRDAHNDLAHYTLPALNELRAASASLG